MDALMDIGIFAAKTALIAAAVAFIVALVTFLGTRARSNIQLQVDKINERYTFYRDALQTEILDKKSLKELRKETKKKEKALAGQKRPRVFVLDFKGDIQASHIKALREEVTAILTSCQSTDQVVIKIESPGGLVTGYGLVASQLARLRDKGLFLTVCVDEVAASGGYMAACVGNRIVAAPFAVIGSIGVYAAVPNIHRLLKKYDVDFKEVTAGEYKRTVSVLGENTPQGLQKFQEQIQETHNLFKRYVHQYRPQLAIDKVATGEHWYGTQALDLALVDMIQTSDDLLFGLSENHDLYEIKYKEARTLSERLVENFGDAALTRLQRLVTYIHKARYGAS